MKTLKTVLFSTYALLAILLLINYNTNKTEASTRSSDTLTEEPVDTADVVRTAEKVGNNGALKVTLLWNFEGDIDLHVKQPNGREIYYDDKSDANTGGYLDVDNMDGGNGSAENIYWENPPKGKYTVSLVYYQSSRSTDIVGSGDCTIVVFQQGKSPKTYRAHMSTVKETKKIINILIR